MIGPRTKLTLQQSTQTSDSMGGYTESWSNIREISGIFMNRKAIESFSSWSNTVRSSHYFSVKNLRDLSVSEKDRFIDADSNVFEIVYISYPGGKKAITIFWLKKVE